MKRIYEFFGRLLFIATLPFIRLMLKRTERVYVCVSCNGEYVLVKNWLARDTWRLPGGGKRKNETYAQAAVRELQEELGIVVLETDMRCIGKSVATTDRLGFRYHLFLVSIKQRATVRPSTSEITDMKWVKKLPVNHTAELDTAQQCLDSVVTSEHGIL